MLPHKAVAGEVNWFSKVVLLKEVDKALPVHHRVQWNNTIVSPLHCGASESFRKSWKGFVRTCAFTEGHPCSLASWFKTGVHNWLHKGRIHMFYTFVPPGRYFSSRTSSLVGRSLGSLGGELGVELCVQSSTTLT